METNFGELLTELARGKKDKLEVMPDNFMQFQKALMNSQYRKKIIGEAKHKGVIIYHYEK
ncbi:hypothetical protein [Liquorilactobacillus oeni]|uniref:Uncharacterized protein n=1 Tax=Liquorilactobacillus oeni DSM 19972 TaxID=1423777 RepID=A0A0R1MD63_9LACO|nr:hypothetical protein [Liquorilactobacillus oeni]KRL05980.1 hypothetical protein FD46_GL000312 [Liquorilactobacillus oeni DSM 19972]